MREIKLVKKPFRVFKHGLLLICYKIRKSKAFKGFIMVFSMKNKKELEEDTEEDLAENDKDDYDEEFDDEDKSESSKVEDDDWE